MIHERARLTALLLLLGCGWGLTQPLIKITVTAGYQPLGLVFWQLLIGAVLLGILRWRQMGRLPFTARTFAVWLMIATIGTLIPNTTGYRAAFHLPSGIMSIVIATIPMMAFPIALALGNDRFSLRRLGGLALGLIGVSLIALPEASLPDRAMIAFLPLALVAPFCYACESNIVARWGTAGLDPFQVLFGASALGTVIALPLALGSGQFFIPRPPFILADLTMTLSAIIHVLVYSGYVWLIGRAGAVFAGQVSYLVTGSGVLWAMFLLGESYSLWIWLALLCMGAGLALVQPRLAPALALSKTGAHG
ncbi:DMT family transporter [Cognatiyoonia sp. IB215446]|uniref:DMT family transporter n=1 Tax=Cognatiyoonia sp. IB215446 TaxID=3097355 RepID=UPI002A0FC50E|nr:DMT family transporter [Cognatiyoonia sp. IB215446]MDX8347596.1 DMT family transporter [Cognatiyoonia sp. IB215446]